MLTFPCHHRLYRLLKFGYSILPPFFVELGGMSDFLSDKTGVTGAWTLGAGLTAVAISKEILIIHNEVSG